MSTVPSLVGAGTVVAAAAAGLIFGQPSEPISSPRPNSNKRKLTAEFQSPRSPITLSRPGTGSAAPVSPVSAVDDYPFSSFHATQNEPISTTTISASLTRHSRPAGAQNTSQTTPPKGTLRRQSFIRQGDLATQPIAEHSRDSISSNGSWMRRLSIRPLSQHGSPRSSILLGPDSPSITFSLGSAAPILSPVGSLPPQLPPNKLVKRATPGVNSNSGSLSRRGSRSQMPTLRRPATSHQRSATLQQFQPENPGCPPPPPPKYSLDQQIRPRHDLTRIQTDSVEPEPSRQHVSWTSFFHSRLTKAFTGGSPRSNSGSPSNPSVLVKRVHLQPQDMPRAYLINTAMLSNRPPAPQKSEAVENPRSRIEENPILREVTDSPHSTEETPSKRARRSISMHFTSTTNWISRTGSIRRSKRGATGGKRHVSAPLAAENTHEVQEKNAMEDIFSAADHSQQEPGPTANIPPQTRRRNASSPLPPLTRLSSFNIDLSHVGVSTPVSPGPMKAVQPQPTTFVPQQTFPVVPHNRTISGDRTSTFASSDHEARDFMSTDEDDTDFKSDTMFDSFRTMASNRLRSVETPLESMFDESPPSTAGNGKTKRLSIQEILGRSWDGDTRIMEEDEGIPTPVREGQSSVSVDRHHDAGENTDEVFPFENTSPDFAFASGDFGRLSLDDDDEDDWNRDDENTLSNHLSPPSTVNSRGVSPNLRMALAAISGNGGLEHHQFEFGRERPRSNVFDWSEPSPPDKLDASGASPRPKTVHGKQELDLRGGRPPNRKGPTAVHIRSQSVPVVGDPSEPPKSTPKFGTWGLGSKTASEDWDDDFEFEDGSISGAGGKNSTSSVAVPASIQAAQPTVKAHSGQIRELSLLVNDLKRLCRHGRDLDILDSQSAAKWREAENIIALASPDEEMVDDTEGPAPASLNDTPADEQFGGEGYDAMALDSVEGSLDMKEPDVIMTTVVRERQVVRRRSVFLPDDDIFGTMSDDDGKSDRPQTPIPRKSHDSAIIASVMEAMQQQQQRSASDPVKSGSKSRVTESKLFFDTNSLQELVKRASHLRDVLSDLVRRAQPLTQSPAGTPRRERHAARQPDSSPAFTRVFTDPSSSPPKRVPKSHSTNSVLSNSPRMQMMIVN